MSFKSVAQRNLCWVQYSRDIREGRRPKWNCAKFEDETRDKKLPYYHRKGCNCSSGSFKKSYKKSRKRSYRLTPISKMNRKKRNSIHKTITRSRRKIRTGPRGGKYVISRGKKIYV